MTKAIAFDCGGVIVDLNFDQAVNSFRTKAGWMDIENYLDPWRQKGFISDLETGKISEEEFYVECFKKCKPGTTRDIIQECFDDFLDGIPAERVNLIKALSKKYPLYVLSNNNPIALRGVKRYAAERGLDFDECFTKLFISSEMKLVKPEAPIFLKAIEEIGFEPSEIMFIDDSQRNVDGAKAVGIDARFSNNNETFKSLLQPLL